jgi:hypothetical protein
LKSFSKKILGTLVPHEKKTYFICCKNSAKFCSIMSVEF